MMLFGPNTIENGTTVAGKPFVRYCSNRYASTSSFWFPYSVCRSERSTGSDSRIGRTLGLA